MVVVQQCIMLIQSTLRGASDPQNPVCIISNDLLLSWNCMHALFPLGVNNSLTCHTPSEREGLVTLVEAAGVLHMALLHTLNTLHVTR